MSDIEKLTLDKIDHLPPQIQLWLKKIGIIGKEPIRTARFKQKGFMKLKPDQKKWIKATAFQTVTTEEPSFIWDAKIQFLPMLNVTGRDVYLNGEGSMLIKLASLFPIAKVANKRKVNQSTLQRYLLEMPWYPSAVANEYLTWEIIDQLTVKATMTYKGTSGTAVYHFEESGDLQKVSALRYKDSDEQAKPIECIGEVIETNEVNGIRLPTKLEVSWMLDEGKFTWYKVEIYDVEFNVPTISSRT